MELKWLLRPSWTMVITWVARMSGVISVAWWAYDAFSASSGRTVPAAGQWPIFRSLAGIAFVIAGLTVLFLEHRRADQAEARLAAALDPPKRDFLPKTGDQIVAEIAAHKWVVREELAATYVGRWIRGRGSVINVVKSESGYALLVAELNEATVSLEFPKAERTRIEILDTGHMINYEGRVAAASELYVRLVEVAFTHLPTLPLASDAQPNSAPASVDQPKVEGQA